MFGTAVLVSVLVSKTLLCLGLGLEACGPSTTTVDYNDSRLNDSLLNRR